MFDAGWSEEEPPREKQPAFRLLDLGPAAAPLLIEHLEDPRPTRSMGYWRHFAPATFYLLRVGDACQEILSRIAGRSFFAARSTNSYMQKDGETSAVKQAALEWWKEYREKGEEKLLAEGVAAGGRDAPAQAGMLLEKYPRTALDAIVAGIRAARDAWVRTDLVNALARIAGDGPLPFLLDEPAGYLATALGGPPETPFAIRTVLTGHRP